MGNSAAMTFHEQQNEAATACIPKEGSNEVQFPTSSNSVSAMVSPYQSEARVNLGEGSAPNKRAQSDSGRENGPPRAIRVTEEVTPAIKKEGQAPNHEGKSESWARTSADTRFSERG